MSKNIIVTSGKDKYKITLEVHTTNQKGLCAFLYGGTLPHIGGCVLASSSCCIGKEKLSSCDVWSSTVPGHKDTIVAEAVAKRICCATGETVSVSAGIHIDKANKNDISILYNNCIEAAEKFILIYNENKNNNCDSSLNDKLICVDAFDRPIGSETKLICHQKGILHRAFSVFLYHNNKMLIQRRAFGKYHSGGLWTNSCCSHPREGEELTSAVKRRLNDELGIKSANCRETDSFVYYRSFENGMSEYEYDHIFIGDYSGEIVPSKNEIIATQWIDIDELSHQIVNEPQKFTIWFLTAVPKVLQEIV